MTKVPAGIDLDLGLDLGEGTEIEIVEIQIIRNAEAIVLIFLKCILVCRILLVK